MVKRCFGERGERSLSESVMNERGFYNRRSSERGLGQIGFDERVLDLRLACIKYGLVRLG